MNPTNNPMGPTNIPMNTTNNPMNPTNTPMGTTNNPMGPTIIPMSPTDYPNSNNDVIVTKEQPLKIFTRLSTNTAVTVNAAQGKLEVYLLFGITRSDTSIDKGKFYLYDSSDLTNFVTVLDPYQNEYYRKVATNKSFTIFSMCEAYEGDQCGIDNTQIVYRIVEYHSAHCDASAGENIGMTKTINVALIHFIANRGPVLEQDAQISPFKLKISPSTLFIPDDPCWGR